MYRENSPTKGLFFCVRAGPLGSWRASCRDLTFVFGRLKKWEAISRRRLRRGLYFRACFSASCFFMQAFTVPTELKSAFLPSFLADHGLSGEQIAFILAAGTIARLVAGPAAGRIADHWQAPRTVLTAAAAAAGFFGLFYIIAFGFLPLLAVSVVHAAVTAPLAPLADALALAASTRASFQYGWVRGAGSAAFVAGTLLSGQLIDRFGLSFIIIASSVLFSLMAFSSLLIRAPREPSRHADISSPEAFLSLFGIPVFRRLLLVTALVVGSHAMNDAFAVISWRKAGFSGATISLLWSESVVAEVVVFFVIGPWLLSRLGPAGAAGVSAVAGVLRWTVMGWTTSLSALVWVQALHGLTFALLHLAAMQLISRQIPERLSATAQTVYGAFALGLASAALTVASGYIYENFGRHAFWAMALLCAIALPLVKGLHQGSDASS